MKYWQQCHLILTAASIPVAALVCWLVYKQTIANKGKRRRDSDEVVASDDSLTCKTTATQVSLDSDSEREENISNSLLDAVDLTQSDVIEEPFEHVELLSNVTGSETSLSEQIHESDFDEKVHSVTSEDLSFTKIQDAAFSNKTLIRQSSESLRETDSNVSASSDDISESDAQCEESSNVEDDSHLLVKQESEIELESTSSLCSNSQLPVVEPTTPESGDQQCECKKTENVVYADDKITRLPNVESNKVAQVLVNKCENDTATCSSTDAVSLTSESLDDFEAPLKSRVEPPTSALNGTISHNDDDIHDLKNCFSGDTVTEQQCLQDSSEGSTIDSDSNVNNNNNIFEENINCGVVFLQEDSSSEKCRQSSSCNSCNDDQINSSDVLKNGWSNGYTKNDVSENGDDKTDSKKRPSSLTKLILSEKNENEPDTMQVYVEFPSERVGLLIGKQGRNIKQLKVDSGADVYVHAARYREDIQVLQICGTQSEVESCVSRIKRRFNDITLSPFDPSNLSVSSSSSTAMSPVSTPPLVYPVPSISQLRLPEGVTVEVVVSTIASVDCLFLQQYTHPSYHNLDMLERAMALCYAEPTTPCLPNPVQVGLICAAPQEGMWYRAQVVQCFEDSEEILIKFMDYGGYATLPGKSIKQIRADFVTLPFQAVECYLDNIAPPDDNRFSEETANKIAEMLKDGRFQARVTGYRSDGHPRIHLFKCHNNKVLLINQEMATKGLATWIEPAPFQSS